MQGQYATWMARGLMVLMMVAAGAANAGETLRLKRASFDPLKLSGAPAWVRQDAKVNRSSRYQIVQFAHTITATDRQALAIAGAEIITYLPDDAYLVRMARDGAKTLRQISGVRAVMAFLPSFKISPDIVLSQMNASEVGEYVVRLAKADERAAVESQIAAEQVVASEDNIIIARLTGAQVDALSRVDGVEWIQPNYPVEPLHMKLQDEPLTGAKDGDYSELTGYESGTKVMKFDAAWARGYYGTGQMVSVADTGLDTGNLANLHSDLKGRVPKGLIFGLFAKGWEDPMGHGTHVAGSVAGNGTISGGAIRGGAYAAQVLPEGMWSPVLNNLSVPTKLSDLFSKAYAEGARIHTNSWGNPNALGVYDNMANQVDDYMFKNQDFLVLFAAGNSGEDRNKDGRIDPGSVSSPGTAKNALTVGASKNLVKVGGLQTVIGKLKSAAGKWDTEPIASSELSENPNGLAMFSSRGPTTDGRIKPDIVAPGTNILSTRTHQQGAELLWGEYNAEYLWSGGTSMATPLTAGAAAVTREYLMKGKGQSSPSAALVKAVLMHTAYDMFPGQFGERSQGQELMTRRPNADEGYGRVDMDKATNLEGTQLVDERTGVETGQEMRYQVQVKQAGEMSITLVYTDAPAAAGAAKALVNDLDVAVYADKARLAAPEDHTNNNEQIDLKVAAGDYEIVVKGTNVPQGLNGKQPYAMVVTIK